jgi:hypothetical protein
MAQNEDIGKLIGVEVAAALKSQAKAIGFRMELPGLIASLKQVAETFKGIQMVTLAAAAKSDKTLANVGRTFAQGNFSLKAVIASETLLIKANMKRHAFDTRYLTFLQQAGVDSKAMLMQFQFMQQTLGTTRDAELGLAETLHETAQGYERHTDLLVRALKGVEEATVKTQFLGGEGKGVDFTVGVAEMVAKYGDQHVKAIQDIANKFLVPSVEQLQRITLLGLTPQDVAGGIGGQDVAGGTAGAIQTVIDAMNNSQLGAMRGEGERGGYVMDPLANLLGISNGLLALMQAEYNEANNERNLKLVELNKSISDAESFAGAQWDKLLGTMQLALLPAAEAISLGVRKLTKLTGLVLPAILLRLTYLAARGIFEFGYTVRARYQGYRQMWAMHKQRTALEKQGQLFAQEIQAAELNEMRKGNLISERMHQRLIELNATSKIGNAMSMGLAFAGPLILGIASTAALALAGPNMESAEYTDPNDFHDQLEERDRLEAEIAAENLEQNKRVADHLSPQSNISALTERSNALATAMLQSLSNQAIIAEDTFDELQTSNRLLMEQNEAYQTQLEGFLSPEMQ